jgi:hypothetical protein
VRTPSISAIFLMSSSFPRLASNTAGRGLHRPFETRALEPDIVFGTWQRSVLNVGRLISRLFGLPMLWPSSPPLACASVLSASRFSRLCLFPYHRKPSSQVPYESLDWSHASCTPDIAWPVSRYPPSCSRSWEATPVSMPSMVFRCVIRGSLALVSPIPT